MSMMQTVRKSALGITVAAAVAATSLIAAVPAEARVSTSDTSELGELCQVVQAEWDRDRGIYQSAKGAAESARWWNFLMGDLDAWDKFGCRDAYGLIDAVMPTPPSPNAGTPTTINPGPRTTTSVAGGPGSQVQH